MSWLRVKPDDPMPQVDPPNWLITLCDAHGRGADLVSYYRAVNDRLRAYIDEHYALKAQDERKA